MELKSTTIGRRLAQHPYHQVKLLSAGLEVSGEHHCYTIPYTQLVAAECKRGLVWGELEFELVGGQVVRLHGTPWQQTTQFYQCFLQDWQRWGLEMSEIAASLLISMNQQLDSFLQSERWLSQDLLQQLQDEIHRVFNALPLPIQRLNEYPSCSVAYQSSLNWLDNGEQLFEQHNQAWQNRLLQQHQHFFNTIESQPLNLAQQLTVISPERAVLTLAGAGSGKTSVLVARVGWLLQRAYAEPEQILLLAFGRQAATEIEQRITKQIGLNTIQAKTFHALALSILQSSSNKPIKISDLETNIEQRHAWLIANWQQQCEVNKNYAKGWYSWLRDEFKWQPSETLFWHNNELTKRLLPRLDYWFGLVKAWSGSQAELIATATESDRAIFSKRLRLLNPLIKLWRSQLKKEQSIDFNELIQKATQVLEKGKFISPWTHILIDEFQDISPQRAKFIQALINQQKKEAHVFAVGDDWQSIYRFSGATLSLTTAFSNTFANGKIITLDTSYRFGQNLAQIANHFIQQNPHQLRKTLNGSSNSKNQAIAILEQSYLEKLLDKMSGFVKPEENVLILGRYEYLRPEVMDYTATRWPRLNINFMTIHASKGQQADYVIVVGMTSGIDGFPAEDIGSIIEKVILPPIDDYPYAEERRLMYVALTRAKNRVWLLQDKKQPSIFIDELRKMGVSVLRKP